MTESDHFTSSKLLRDVVALGKKYAETGYPNPNRDRCPNRSSLRALAYRDRRLTLEDLPSSHIVSCSPCFQEYAHFRRMALLVRGIRITAASLAAAAMIFVAARVVWNHAHHSAEPKISEKQLAELKPPLTTKQQAPPLVPFPLRVDLASFSPTRGEGQDGRVKKVHLPRKLLRVNFLLPLGLEPAEYEIQLQDSTGAVFIDKRVIGRASDGITSVEIDMDLMSTTRDSFTLMIRPPGLDWRKFPVVVE
jgi:hypothetical protein